MNRVLIADDHDIVRFGLTMMIQETFPGCTPDEAWNAEGVMALMKKTAYPLVLLDLVIRSNTASGSATGFKKDLNISTFQPGIYLVKVNGQTFKIVKQ